jgi:hypothetical protein
MMRVHMGIMPLDLVLALLISMVMIRIRKLIYLKFRWGLLILMLLKARI